MNVLAFVAVGALFVAAAVYVAYRTGNETAAQLVAWLKSFPLGSKK